MEWNEGLNVSCFVCVCARAPIHLIAYQSVNEVQEN